MENKKINAFFNKLEKILNDYNIDYDIEVEKQGYKLNVYNVDSAEVDIIKKHVLLTVEEIKQINVNYSGNKIALFFADYGDDKTDKIEENVIEVSEITIDNQDVIAFKLKTKEN